MNRTFLTILIVLVNVGCSSGQKVAMKTVNTNKIKLKSSFYEESEVVCDYDTDKNIVAKFHCILDYHDKGRMYLSTGNAAKSLQVVEKGLGRFPYDDRLKTLFSDAKKVFINSTIDISKEVPLDCKRVDTRNQFILKISPDTSLSKIKKCVSIKTTNKAIKIDFKFHNFTNKYDVKNYKQINQAISNQIFKNNEDNYDSMAMLGIAELSKILKEHLYSKFKLHNSVKNNKNIGIDLIGDSKFQYINMANLKDLFTTNFHFDNGVYVNKGVYWDLKVGLKNKQRLNEYRKFVDFTPRKLVYTLSFYNSQNEKLSSHYYLSDFKIIGYGKDKTGYHIDFDDAPSDYYENITPEKYKIDSPTISTLHGQNSPDRGLRLTNIDIDKVGDFSYAILKFEPEVTYKIYKETKGIPVTKKWKRVLRSFLKDGGT